MVTAVVFDMDGVIFDTEALILRCWKEYEEEYHIQKLEEMFLACVGTTVAKTKEIVLMYQGEDFPYDEIVAKTSKRYHRIEEEVGIPLKPGVFELFDFLKERGYRIGLASSTRYAVVKKQLIDAGLWPYLDAAVGGDMAGKSKPEPDIYLKACEALGVKPEDAYAIEDSYNGIRSAYRAGMKPIMVPDLLRPTEEMEELSVLIASSLSAVRVYLEAERRLV